MPYSIKRQNGFVEVEVWGETSAAEIIAAVNEIHAEYPRKECSDLWVLARESMLPLSTFPTIIEAIVGLCGEDHVYRRSAIVASDQFQKAMADMYRSEADTLPFEVGVFISRDDAIQWLKGPPADRAGKG